jgi:hypothetical protein
MVNVLQVMASNPGVHSDVNGVAGGLDLNICLSLRSPKSFPVR